MRKKQAIIALNGQIMGRKEEYRSIFNEGDYTIIAADGGLFLLEKLNLTPNVLLGDFDSIPLNRLEFYTEKKVKIIRYPVEKNETDGELAISYCLDEGFTDVIMVGTRGGRLDHQLANILLLEYAYHNDLNLLIKEPGMEMGIINGNKRFYNCSGEYLSLIPLSEEVKGVSITGCRYNLEGATLYRYKTRGISNEIIENIVELSVKKGILFYLKLERI